jgi:hypothetical protein
MLFCPYDGIFTAELHTTMRGKKEWRVTIDAYQYAYDCGENAVWNATATHWMPLPEPPK